MACLEDMPSVSSTFADASEGDASSAIDIRSRVPASAPCCPMSPSVASAALTDCRERPAPRAADGSPDLYASSRSCSVMSPAPTVALRSPMTFAASLTGSCSAFITEASAYAVSSRSLPPICAPSAASFRTCSSPAARCVGGSIAFIELTM